MIDSKQLKQGLQQPKQLLRNVIRRLPVWPPSMVAAQALNRLWWPRVDRTT